MNIFHIISDALYNWNLRKSGQECPGEVRYVRGWGKDWKPIDPYSTEEIKATAKEVKGVMRAKKPHTE